jgi:DNA modification methylase
LKIEEVLEFSQEGHITKNYDHETKKPETLTRALILTCSRPGDLVLIPFAGSGTECAMSAKESRPFVGYETTKKHADMSNDRVKEVLRTPSLFALS